MTPRALARTASLLFFAGLAAYLAHAALAGWLVRWIAGLGLERVPAWLQLTLGIALLDASKLLALLPVAWVVGPLLTARPWVVASALLAICFALEAAIHAALLQAGGLWTPWPLALLRLTAAALLLWPLTALVRWRRPAPPNGAAPAAQQAPAKDAGL